MQAVEDFVLKHVGNYEQPGDTDIRPGEPMITIRLLSGDNRLAPYRLPARTTAFRSQASSQRESSFLQKGTVQRMRTGESTRAPR